MIWGRRGASTVGNHTYPDGVFLWLSCPSRSVGERAETPARGPRGGGVRGARASRAPMHAAAAALYFVETRPKFSETRKRTPIRVASSQNTSTPRCGLSDAPMLPPPAINPRGDAVAPHSTTRRALPSPVAVPQPPLLPPSLPPSAMPRHSVPFHLALSLVFLGTHALLVASVPSDTGSLIPAALAELPDDLGTDISNLMVSMDMTDQNTHFSRLVSPDVGDPGDPKAVNQSLVLMKVFGLSQSPLSASLLAHTRLTLSAFIVSSSPPSKTTSP